ncbi:PROBABLE CONSERVED INTEGRAL MEMBRANE ALANINE AND LEUCINE RICH PROTEIN [[Actinomadura] parvosata subsp. kistnae]|uniref:DUF3159 domain-containing protein n=1 Tax=[Actinomadura] parvosata subsp. kistnae TaxID=1909395 RepID=A0A1V0ADJ9_9ACTN|nr:DUF3159 domain-containing protein [Nonomuraea sp. ATCC 55076]AQZ68249.1 hypothetical protein BKM31_48360 [Nonomuraea sp. ATCC 55076]SPL93340.1 PROBABLE CONSERVED INTEGRAL MEMBRANE ALANINE AND LEUCINE RICH PROTEIN [Actinomadura parvosata subsp. kistnae]
MSLDVLTQKSLSWFAAMGGWRTVAEGAASRVLFLVAYLVTGQVSTSALVAVGGVAVFAVARVLAGRKYWQAAVGLVVVGVSASLAGSTGHAADFYLPTVLMQAAGGAVFLASILVRWPVIGLAVGAARAERFGWRRDPARRRRYQLCTAVFVAKYGIATIVLLPLYLTGKVTPLGIAAVLLGGAPAMGVCVYLCWRILRARADPAPAAIGQNR